MLKSILKKNVAKKKTAGEAETKKVLADDLRQCPVCRSVQFWIDGYGQLHCGGCERPSSLSMVVRVLEVPTARRQLTDDDFRTWVTSDGRQVVALKGKSDLRDGMSLEQWWESLEPPG